MHSALYGPAGFYRRELPGDHFRTAVTASAVFAQAIRVLADRVDAALDFPDPFDVVDVGAGDGRLLTGLGVVPSRWRLTGVEVSGRFVAEIPAVTGLLVANEWLDNVPLDVVAQGRAVEVDETGVERLGADVHPADLAWAARWWPGVDRVEIGRTRDEAWAHAVSQVSRGLAVAIDYGHQCQDRRTTLTGYREGRQVVPVPDGSCDLTAHVALDSCAAAAGSRLISQREALLQLGISAERPDRCRAVTDAGGYLSALANSGHGAELLDPAGLGGFGWLVHAVGITDPLPPAMRKDR
ncbi:MAG: SAM-dependent methyltransferase [Mycobacteriales bacterium]